ncbi:hypothetical protein C0992_012274, partial [Termitomyces sp. T32_za158]
PNPVTPLLSRPPLLNRLWAPKIPTVMTRLRSTPHIPGAPSPTPTLFPGFPASCPASSSTHFPRPNDPEPRGSPHQPCLILQCRDHPHQPYLILRRRNHPHHPHHLHHPAITPGTTTRQPPSDTIDTRNPTRRPLQ